MISFSGNLRAFVCNKPTHMGCSFNALAGLVRNTMDQDPTDPALYLFFNKRRNMVKILYWDRTGYAIWSKRLEEGVFGASSYELDYASLVIHWLLQNLPDASTPEQYEALTPLNYSLRNQ